MHDMLLSSSCFDGAGSYSFWQAVTFSAVKTPAHLGGALQRSAGGSLAGCHLQCWSCLTVRPPQGPQWHHQDPPPHLCPPPAAALLTRWQNDLSSLALAGQAAVAKATAACQALLPAGQSPLAETSDFPRDGPHLSKAAPQPATCSNCYAMLKAKLKLHDANWVPFSHSCGQTNLLLWNRRTSSHPSLAGTPSCTSGAAIIPGQQLLIHA